MTDKLAPQSVNPNPGRRAQDQTPHDREPQTDPERAVVEYVRARWGALIAEACRGTPIPPAFLAALIANESGGSEGARRFEPRVFAKLKGVLNGEVRGQSPLERRQLAGADDETLNALATSYGLTQIMGYHVWGDKPLAVGGSTTTDPHRLLDPGSNLQKAQRMLAEFCAVFHLDPQADFDRMFRCWNTGRPDGKTFNPNYVSMGLARMKVYEAIEAGGQASEVRSQNAGTSTFSGS